MKNFIKENWFKLSIIIIMILIVFVLNSMIEKGIKIRHSGFVDVSIDGSADMGVDGATLYLR